MFRAVCGLVNVHVKNGVLLLLQTWESYIGNIWNAQNGLQRQCYGENRVDWFPWFKCVETSAKIVIIQVVPPQVSQTEMWRKFTKLSMKIDKFPFQKSSAG
jgi:hypothetical protein